MMEERNELWRMLCKNMPLERWERERDVVEERFSLFRPFFEPPFLGFRGIVARSGSEYHVTVAAETDMYPNYVPWVFVTPTIPGAREDGELCVDVGWTSDSTFADVIGAVVLYIEGVCGAS